MCMKKAFIIISVTNKECYYFAVIISYLEVNFSCLLSAMSSACINRPRRNFFSAKLFEY